MCKPIALITRHIASSCETYFGAPSPAMVVKSIIPPAPVSHTHDGRPAGTVHVSPPALTIANVNSQTSSRGIIMAGHGHVLRQGGVCVAKPIVGGLGISAQTRTVHKNELLWRLNSNSSECMHYSLRPLREAVSSSEPLT